jgi:glutamate-1-semialdehyde 2,1-aminomutase
MSWGPLLFGHQDPEVKEAVQSALSRGWSYGTAEPYSLELGELITQSIPVAQKVRFVNSGTEAVMSALRVARAATGRSKVVKFDGCYHGHLDSLLVRAGSGLADMASPDSAGVSAAIAADTLVAPLDDVEALQMIFDRNRDQIAVVAIEPLPANNGLLLQRELFLKEIFKIAHKNGALVLFDEVISGFRSAFGGMAEITGLKPDLVCYGKVIGGGFPVGAYGGRADLMDLVAPAGPVYQAGTLSANPVAMLAGLAMLKKLQREKPWNDLEKKCARLCSELESIARRYAKHPVRLQRFGSIFWMLSGEVSTPDGVARRLEHIPAIQKESFARVFHALLEKGFYLAPSGFEVGFVSTVHTDAHFDALCSAYEQVLKIV